MNCFAIYVGFLDQYSGIIKYVARGERRFMLVCSTSIPFYNGFSFAIFYGFLLQNFVIYLYLRYFSYVLCEMEVWG